MEKQNWKETRIIQHFFLPFTLSAWHFQEWNQQKEGRERERERWKIKNFWKKIRIIENKKKKLCDGIGYGPPPSIRISCRFMTANCYVGSRSIWNRPDSRVKLIEFKCHQIPLHHKMDWPLGKSRAIFSPSIACCCCSIYLFYLRSPSFRYLLT
jgi:hypothetical protein